MGIISNYSVTNNSEYVYNGSRGAKIHESYQLEVALDRLKKSEVEEIIEYIQSKMIKE